MSVAPTETSPYDGPKVYPQAVALSIIATLACILCVPPLILQIKNRNLPITILLISSALMNLQNTINPIIWPNDDIEGWFSGKIFCDIEAKLQVGLAIIPLSSGTCICRQLATILSTRQPAAVLPSPSWIRKHFNFEVTLCVLLPITIMSVHILVQPWRYSIFSVSGCRYCLHRSFMTWVLILVWQIPVSVLGLAYSVLTIVRLIRHQRQVSTLLATANVSKARFAMVFALTTISAVVYTPLVLYLYLKSPEGNTRGWSWQKVHRQGWIRTIVMLKSDGEAGLDRWMQVASGFVLFGVFGLGGDAINMYRRWARVTGLHEVWGEMCSTSKHGDEPRGLDQEQPPCTNRPRARPPTLYEIDDDLDITMADMRVSHEGNGSTRTEDNTEVEPVEIEVH